MKIADLLDMVDQSRIAMIETYIVAMHAPDSPERAEVLDEIAAQMREVLLDVMRTKAGESAPALTKRMAALYGVTPGESAT